MADSSNDRLDLIQRLAEKQAGSGDGSLAERAAEKLHHHPQSLPP
jgi:hypothetical protein